MKVKIASRHYKGLVTESVWEQIHYMQETKNSRYKTSELYPFVIELEDGRPLRSYASYYHRGTAGHLKWSLYEEPVNILKEIL